MSLMKRLGLPAWFAAMTAVHLGTTSTTREAIGLDARIYYRGASAWVHGGDPWSAFAQMGGGYYHFAGAPPTVELFGPFALVSEAAFVAIALLASFFSAVYILQRLHLPGSWLLFPPLAQALISANPQLVVLAFLLAAWPVLQGFAPMLKVYAVVPLLIEVRWKAITASAGFLVISLLVAPDLWRDYMSRFAAISERLNLESAGGFSAWGLPPTALALLVGSLIVLAVLDRKAAAWLAVPALWPATQLHYSAFALPVITPVMAFVLAIPQHGIPALVVVGLAVWRLGGSVAKRYPEVVGLLRRWRITAH